MFLFFLFLLFLFPSVKSSQVTFIYIALFTIQIVSKQLHSDNMKITQQRLSLEENCVIIHLKYGRSIILLNIECPQLSKPKAKATVARNQNSISDRMEKKTLGEPRLCRGQFSSGQQVNSVWLRSRQHYRSEVRLVVSMRPSQGWWGWHFRDALWSCLGAGPPYGYGPDPADFSKPQK